jgi:hypothetical protein
VTTKRRNLIIASVVLVVASAALLCVMRGKSSVDEYVAQLRARGERLYFTDAPFPKMTNGTPGLDRFISAADLITGFSYIDVMDVKTGGVVTVAWQNTNTVVWPLLLTSLQRNERWLREIRESVADPEPDMGWQTNIFTTRRTYVQQRKGAQLLAAATISALHEKNFGSAFDNLQALSHLAQMERDEGMLVAQMVRVAVAGLGLATTWEALQSEGLNDAQWSQLQTEWAKVDLISAIEHAFVGERLYCFNHMEMARKGDTNAVNWTGGKIKWQDRLQTTIWRATVAQQDELFYLKTVQRYIDHCRSVSAGTPAVEVNKRFQQDIDKLNNLLSEPLTRFKYPFCMIAIPNFARASATAFRCEVQRRLTITAIGIKRYQLRYGKLPETLNALVPEFCPATLLDPMDWKPLHYRVNPDATFTLYSVGENGKDDGGNPIWTTNTSGWLSGMDIVWPKVAQTNAAN